MSLGEDKPMDIFAGWDNYVERLTKNWNTLVTDDDTVMIAGDISWAMKLEQTYTDFKYIDDLPGKKIFLKGNHDYWWETVGKMVSVLRRSASRDCSVAAQRASLASSFSSTQNSSPPIR